MRFTMNMLLLLASLLLLANSSTITPPKTNTLTADTGISPDDPGMPLNTISPFDARVEDGIAIIAAKKRCDICKAYVSDCVRNGHQSFPYCRDEQCKANPHYCGGCNNMPCKQPKLKSRDEQQYSETERSPLPLEDPSTAEAKTPDDGPDASKFTWPFENRPVGLPIGKSEARNLPATEHDIDLPSTPIEVEDDDTELGRCKRKCRYFLDGCKKIKDNKEMRKCMKNTCPACRACAICYNNNWG